MNDPTREDRELKELLGSAPLGEAPSLKLMARLRAAAGGPRVKHMSPWPGRLTMAAVAAVAVIAVGLSISPVRAEAKSFQNVVKATQRADEFLFRLRSFETGNAGQVDIACAGGKFTLTTSDGFVMLLEGSEIEIYDPKQNRVTALNLGALVDPKVIARQIKDSFSTAIEQMDLKKMLADMQKDFGKENIEIGPITHRFGRSVYDVTLAKADEPQRVRMTVDADTDLPMSIQIDEKRDGEYRPHAALDLQFGTAISADSLKGSIPADAQRVEVDLGKMLGEGFKGSHGESKDLEKLFEGIGKGLEGLMDRFGDDPGGETKIPAPEPGRIETTIVR